MTNSIDNLAEQLFICFSKLKDRDGKFVMFHRHVPPQDAMYYAQQVAQMLEEEQII